MEAVAVTLAVELPEPPAEARMTLLDELALAGIAARVRGDGIVLEWRAAEWEPPDHALAALRLEAAGSGTRVTFELHRDPQLLAAWFVSQAIEPLLRSAAADAYGDWLTDRRARRPSGAEARETYGDPLFHWPNFRAILAELELTADDRLVEIGCGGGALLHEALKSGCTAAAIDHSPDMVVLARDQNSEAITAGRLEIVQGDAAVLPLDDGTFTAAVMTGVLGFLPDPVTALAEIRRVLAPGGRFVALGADPAMKDTPAAPEPMASRLRFYSDEEHVRLAREAGFDDARVERLPLDGHAREAGVPEELVSFFEGPGAPFLVAGKH